MKAERLSLNDPAFQAARKDFYRPKPGLKPAVTFEQYLELFTDEANTFTAIAKALSLSKERVRQVYNNYFSSLFPDRPSGHALYARKRRELAARSLRLSAPVAELADWLRQRNYHCEGVPLFYATGTIRAFQQGALLINKKYCQVRTVHCTATTHAGNWPSYTPVRVTIRSIRRYDFLIVIQKVKGYPKRSFIIPITDILKVYTGPGIKTLYIPLKKLAPYHNRYQRMDFWQYENAWPLLKQT